MTDPSAVPFAGPLTPDWAPSAETRALVDELDAIVWRSDPATFEFLYISRGIERWLGFRVEQWMRPGFWLGRVHPEDRERVDAVCRAAIARSHDHVIEYRMLAEDGSTVWLRDHVRFVRGSDGRTLAQGVLVEIGREKAAEGSLRSQHERMARLLDTVDAAVLVLDATGRVQRANLAAERLLGRSRARLEGCGFSESLVHAADRVPAEDLLQRVRGTRSRISAELRVRSAREDSATVVLWTLTALPGDGPGGMVATGLDLTDRLHREEQLRRTEADLRQAQKMEALGRLAGGVAHDFNNSVTAILGFAQALSRELADRPESLALVEGVREAAQHAAQLAGQLRDLGRRRSEALTPLDLALEVSRLQRVLERAAGDSVVLEMALEASGARVLGDACELSQVLLNLTLNARDAMPRGGRLRVSTRFLPAERATRGVELVVTDTGQGMDAVTVARAFEPFFTTKGAAGSGLGLATVYTTVARWGGRIHLESTVGQGTTVRIVLPLAARVGRGRPVAREKSPVAPPAALLVVEDEPSVRRLMVEALQREGYEVLAAAHGREALAVLEARGHACDLVVTDVIMPGMGGLELAVQLQRSRPGLPVLFVSGYSVGGPGGEWPENAELLAKPFAPDTLAARVRRMLAERPLPV